MKLKELVNKLRILETKGSMERDITGVQIDSRQIVEGNLFIAVRGTVVDGHNYIGKALENGATAILCETIPADSTDGIPYLQVENTEQVVGLVATTFYGNPTSKLKLVGVTGTNGKTTIATVLYEMFRYMGHKVGLLSTVCNYIDGEAIPTDHTTPDPITLNALLA
jgi:UDP-N-acetylmuramoyl-L-alanyl-D-glutamate--2,6-diaminopimelate ligase